MCQSKDNHKVWPGCLPTCLARGQGAHSSWGLDEFKGEATYLFKGTKSRILYYILTGKMRYKRHVGLLIPL